MVLLLSIGLILFAFFFIQKKLVKVLIIALAIGLFLGTVLLERLDDTSDFESTVFVHGVKNVLKILTTSA